MSTESNTKLMELAHEHIEYWAGTPRAEVIQKYADMGELDMLEVALKESANAMFDAEYNPEATE